MSESVGDQWGEYLRVGRRMSEHTVDAYVGDLRALLDYLGIGWDAPAGEFAHALTQRRIRSWLADTLVRGERARRSLVIRQPFVTSPHGPCEKKYCRATRQPLSPALAPINVYPRPSTSPTRVPSLTSPSLRR